MVFDDSDYGELVDIIKEATQNAYNDLTQAHPGDFYYFSLTTTGEAHPPVITAWSKEALECAVEQEDDKEDAMWGLKWSYAESPFYCFGEKHFREVERMFRRRPDIRHLAGVARNREFEFRLNAMEEAMQILNKEGLFGRGESRNDIYINVEVMPPDRSNTERAMRLNPPEALKQWLEEAAE